MEPLQQLQQREVALEHRLPEPLLLEVVLVVRVADEREVGVEHEHQRAPRLPHRPALSSVRSATGRTEPDRPVHRARPGWWAAGTRRGESSGSWRGAEGAEATGAAASGSDHGNRSVRTSRRDDTRPGGRRRAALRAPTGRVHPSRPSRSTSAVYASPESETRDVDAARAQGQLEAAVEILTPVEAEEQPRLAQPERRAALQLAAEVPEDEERGRVAHQQERCLGSHLARRGDGLGVQPGARHRRAGRTARRGGDLEEGLLDRSPPGAPPAARAE